MDEHQRLTRRHLLRLGGILGAAALTGATGARAGEGQEQKEPAEPAEPAEQKQPPASSEPSIKGETLPQVPRRVLGKTGREIPILLMGGAMKLDRKFDPRLAEAYRFGIDYIDSADCYSGGTGELAVGNFLKRTKLRKKVWITTKSDEHEPEGLEEVLRNSLRKLQTWYIDMFFLHGLEDNKYLNDDLKKIVERLKKDDRIKFFGFSCHGNNVVDSLNKAADLGWVDSIMFRYNFRKYGDKALNKAIDRCKEANIGLIAMKTQASEVSFEDRWKKIQKIGKWTKHQAVLKAVWEDERITAAVSHMDTMEKIQQNVAAALDRKKLGALERQSLDQYELATRGNVCDGCDHICGPAVDAPVRIADTMRCVMYHDTYGEPERARAVFARLPEEARQLADINFDRASAACPNGLDIAKHMERARKILT